MSRTNLETMALMYWQASQLVRLHSRVDHGVRLAFTHMLEHPDERISARAQQLYKEIPTCPLTVVAGTTQPS